VKVKGKAWSWQ